MEAQAADASERLLDFIKEERAFDFTGYKRPSLLRRIAKRMQEVRVADYDAYRELLDRDPAEFAQLFDTILINVTSFFRDEAAWAYLQEDIVPRILAAGPEDTSIRAWSTGCATGEEAYTIAIVLAEAMGEEEFRRRAKIYATDVDEAALAVGRRGAYSAKALEPVPPELREKYFEPFDGGYAFKKTLRRAVIFGRHDLVQDPPISRMDLIVSRNTLMYFDAETQLRILANFRYALTDRGFLVLGKSEALASRTSLFDVVDLKRRVFSKGDAATVVERREPPRARRLLQEWGDASAGLREAGLEVSPVPQVVVEVGGRVVAANLLARTLFDLGLSDIGRPLKDLELSYRPIELRSRLEEVGRERRPVVVRDVELPGSDGGPRIFDVHVVPLTAPTGAALGFGVSFVETTRLKQLQHALERAQSEMETAYEELQSTSEELETTNEELQSTNEELETTNEELQSTNEELETMNEELHSTNEELETMNDELQRRTDEAGRMNAFLTSILRALDAGVIVLDSELRVDIWNDRSEDLWGLRRDEVVGRHLMNLDIGLPLEQLRAPLRAALAGEDDGRIRFEAVNRRGRKIVCDVTFTPLADGGGPAGVILALAAEPVEE